MSTPARALEENLDRVVDSVLRSLAAGGVTPPTAVATGEAPESPAESQVRETIADLCGHVALALKSLDASARPVATYRAPAPTPPAPGGTVRSLDIRR
jgi:hypothetical protein